MFDFMMVYLTNKLIIIKFRWKRCMSKCVLWFYRRDVKIHQEATLWHGIQSFVWDIHGMCDFLHKEAIMRRFCVFIVVSLENVLNK